MKNGILNTQDNLDVLNYNSEKNIESKKLSLDNYLDLMKKELINCIYNNYKYEQFFAYGGHTISANDTYEYLKANEITTQFNGRSNCVESPFSIDENNDIYVNNLGGKISFLQIDFSTQLFSNSNVNGNKYIQIQLVRNSSAIETVNKSVTTNVNGQRIPLSINLGIIAEEGDIIKFGVYGKQNDLFQNTTVNLSLQPRLRNTMQYTI